MDLALNEELDLFYSSGDFQAIDGFLADIQALRVFLSTAQGSYIFDRSWGIDFALLRGLDEIWQVGEYLRTILEGRLGKTIASVEVNSLTKTSKSLFLVLDVKRKNTQNTTILELGYAY